MATYPPGAALPDELSGQSPKCVGVDARSPYLHVTFAIAFFGTDAAWYLMGFIILQTHNYYMRSKKDHPLFKSMVYGTVLIVILASAFEADATYAFLVPVWGDPSPLFSKDISVVSDFLGDLQPLLDAIPAICVQFFFTWRIWTFSMAVYGRKIKLIVAFICLFIILTSLCAFAAVIALTVFITSNFKLFSQITAAILTWSVSTAVADITITACMTIILLHAKSSSYFGETRDRISRLLRLTIQTGLLTTILAIPISPLYIFDPNAASYTLTCYLLGKSYVISLLANLNSRHYRPTALSGPQDENGHLPTVAFAPADGPNHDTNAANPTTHNGILSLIRSVARTVHDDLTREPRQDDPVRDSESHETGDQVERIQIGSGE